LAEIKNEMPKCEEKAHEAIEGTIHLLQQYSNKKEDARIMERMHKIVHT
jgi:hypothetical protein